MNITSVSQRRRRPLAACAGKQRGMVLLVAVIVLALMLLAGLGVMRAADTGNVISGNFSFQQAATQAADRAVSDALQVLENIVLAEGGNNPVANRYLNVRTAAGDLNARGIPNAVNWGAAGVACVDPKGVSVGDCAADTGNYRIQYFIERMCSENPTMTDITDIRAKCEYEPVSPAATTAARNSLRYRVLIRVRGPRGTDEYFEVMVSGPAST